MSRPIYHDGFVEEVLPNALYRVVIDGEGEADKRTFICYVAGKLKVNHIRVLIGDRVAVVLDPYKGKATNRIIRRY
jgi:translation initiation factor IF-1